MFFSYALLSGLLLVTTVIAVPPGLDARATRRREGHQPQVNNRLQKTGDVVFDTGESTNWAGAVFDKGDGTFTSVTGTFTVPIPSGPAGASAAAWVGIDGDTCSTSALLQTGVAFTVSSSGQPTYDAWHEWYPEQPYDFTDISISAGDVIRLTVTAFSANSGNAKIENLTNGKTVSTNLSSSVSLCGQNAEWIVEDYMSDYTQVPFANFGTVTFTNAEASGAAGTYTPASANTFELEEDGRVLTSTSTSGSSVTIKYTG